VQETQVCCIEHLSRELLHGHGACLLQLSKLLGGKTMLCRRHSCRTHHLLLEQVDIGMLVVVVVQVLVLVLLLLRMGTGVALGEEDASVGVQHQVLVVGVFTLCRDQFMAVVHMVKLLLLLGMVGMGIMLGVVGSCMVGGGVNALPLCGVLVLSVARGVVVAGMACRREGGRGEERIKLSQCIRDTSRWMASLSDSVVIHRSSSYLGTDAHQHHHYQYPTNLVPCSSRCQSGYPIHAACLAQEDIVVCLQLSYFHKERRNTKGFRASWQGGRLDIGDQHVQAPCPAPGTC
jgi:hypothetical protein